MGSRRLRLLVVTVLAAVLQVGGPVVADAAVAPRVQVYVDLSGTVPRSGADLVLRGTVLGDDRPVLERAACARGCTWRRVAAPRVPDNVFSRTVPARRAAGAWRVRAGDRVSWPLVVTREGGRTTVRELLATKTPAVDDQPTVDRAEGVIRWVRMARCATAGRRLVAAGRVTNRSDATTDVQITISWTNETSDVLARDTVVLLDVPAGASRPWRAETGRPEGVTDCVPFAIAGRARG